MNNASPIGSRREFLMRAGGGLGGIALSWLLARDGFAAPNPLAAKAPHFAAKAKSVIFLFMVGGPSSIDLFDPKPELTKRHGQTLPKSFGKPISQFTGGDTPLLASTRKFAKYGKSGLEVSDLMPHLATCVDQICFLRSCWSTSTIHAPAMYELHSGRTLMGYPSLGSWVTYGLGSVSDNLPAYCVLTQPEGPPEGGAPCWGAGFLPAVHQGTRLRSGSSPILNLQPPEGVGRERQRRTLDLLKRMNELDRDPADSELAARIESYELAFRMQTSAPEAVDLSKESAKTREAYGLDTAKTADFGTRCLLAQAGRARRSFRTGLFGRRTARHSVGRSRRSQWQSREDVWPCRSIHCRIVERSQVAQAY